MLTYLLITNKNIIIKWYMPTYTKLRENNVKEFKNLIKTVDKKSIRCLEIGMSRLKIFIINAGIYIYLIVKRLF